VAYLSAQEAREPIRRPHEPWGAILLSHAVREPVGLPHAARGRLYRRMRCGR